MVAPDSIVIVPLVDVIEYELGSTIAPDLIVNVAPKGTTTLLIMVCVFPPAPIHFLE